MRDATLKSSGRHGPRGQLQGFEAVHAVGDEAGAVPLRMVRGYVGGYRANQAFVEEVF